MTQSLLGRDDEMVSSPSLGKGKDSFSIEGATTAESSGCFQESGSRA